MKGISPDRRTRRTYTRDENEGEHPGRKTRVPTREHSPKWGTSGTYNEGEHIMKGNEDERGTRVRENIPGRDQIGVSRNCVRTAGF